MATKSRQPAGFDPKNPYEPTAAEKAEMARKRAEVDSSFARHERAKTTPPAPGRTRTTVTSRFEDARKQGGGIQPGSHPEVDKPTPLEQAGAIAKSVTDRIGRILKGGQHRAPSEVIRGKRSGG